MNIPFIVICSILGKAIDWIVQSQYKADNKTKNFHFLFEHVSIYALLTSVTCWLLLSLPVNTFVNIYVVLFLSHFIIDTRKPVKYIMYLKGIPYSEMDIKYGWLQISIDQRLHELVILIIGLAI